MHYVAFTGGIPGPTIFQFDVDEVESYKVINVIDDCKRSKEWAKEFMIMLGFVPPPDPAIPRDSSVYVYITWKPGFEYPQYVMMHGEDFIDFEKAFKGID